MFVSCSIIIAMSPKKTGPKSLEEIYKKEITAFRFMLPEEQHAHITECARRERISTAEYLRRLIAADMQQP